MIQIKWNSGTVDGYYLSGYPIASGFHINTNTQWYEGQSNQADFENRMAYYDLANANNGNPDLHIRLESIPQGDAYLRSLPFTPLEDVRYSWNQSVTSGMTWDYKLGLAGTNPVDVERSNTAPTRLRPSPMRSYLTGSKQSMADRDLCRARKQELPQFGGHIHMGHPN